MEPTVMMLDTMPTESFSAFGAIFAAMAGVMILLMLLMIFMVIVHWKFFQKAGFKGYESIIPVHNFIVLIQIAGKPISYFFLMFIPFANIYFMIKIIHGVSKAFGKGSGFTWGLIFFPVIFFPILVWGKSEYGIPQEDIVEEIVVSAETERPIPPSM